MNYVITAKRDNGLIRILHRSDLEEALERYNDLRTAQHTDECSLVVTINSNPQAIGALVTEDNPELMGIELAHYKYGQEG